MCAPSGAPYPVDLPAQWGYHGRSINAFRPFLTRQAGGVFNSYIITGPGQGNTPAEKKASADLKARKTIAALKGRLPVGIQIEKIEEVDALPN